MRVLPLVICAALAASSATFARPKKPTATESAESAESADKLKEAERLYSAGKYLEAAKLLEELNSREPNPKLLYNIARAYDQAGELEKSLEYYRQYVSSKEGTDATLLKRAALSIDRLEGLVSKANEERRKSEEARLKAEEESKAAQAKAEADAEAAKKALEEAESRRQADVAATNRARSRNKGIAIGSGVVGVLALGGGTFMGLQARGNRAQYDAATTVADKRRFQEATKTQSLLADVGFAVGIAAVATAIFMWPKGGGGEEGAEEETTEEESSDEEEEESSLQWFVSPAGAAMQVRF